MDPKNGENLVSALNLAEDTVRTQENQWGNSSGGHLGLSNNSSESIGKASTSSNWTY